MYFAELYQQWRGFPPSIKLFYVTDIFFAFAMAIQSTLLNLHLLALGFTADHVGSLQSISALAMALVAVPVGIAGDRWSRRAFYLTGSLLFGLPLVLLPLLTSWHTLVVFFTVGAVGSTLMFVHEAPLLAGEVEPAQRATVFSFMFVNFFLWNTLGIQLAGLLAKWMPAGALSLYQGPLVIAGLCGVLTGTIRVFVRFKPQERSQQPLKLKPSRVALTLGVISFLAGAAGALTMNFNNVILAERFDLSADLIATVLTVGGIMGWVGSLAVPWLTARLGTLKAYNAGMVAQALLLLYLGLANGLLAYVPGLWLRMATGSMQMSIGSAMAMQVTPSDERATANSYGVIGRNAGVAVAAKLYGGALVTGSFILPFALAAGFATVTALFATYALRKVKFD